MDSTSPLFNKYLLRPYYMPDFKCQGTAVKHTHKQTRYMQYIDDGKMLKRKNKEK